jgi:hypothetical protein
MCSDADGHTWHTPPRSDSKQTHRDKLACRGRLKPLQIRVHLLFSSYVQVQEYMTAAMGAEAFAAMQAALTVPPLHTCVRVNTLHTTPEVCGQAIGVHVIEPVELGGLTEPLCSLERHVS